MLHNLLRTILTIVLLYSSVNALDSVKQVSAGGSHSLILKSDGTLFSVGFNNSGQLGDGTTTTYRLTPVEIMGNVSSISGGLKHTLILKTDGALFSVGDNTYGQLGDGTTTNSSTPKQIMSGVSSISAGGYHSLILKTDGTLFSVGRNSSGQLGDGTTTNRSTPVEIMSGISSISAGYYHSLILKTDGTLYSFGNNNFGQLGDGTTTDRSTPVEIMSDVSSISAGYYHSLILKTDGTLYSVGSNYSGELGDGTTTNSSTPIEIISGISSISSGNFYSLILKTDRTLFSFGSNSFGQLGDGTRVNRSTPVEVMSDISSVSAGDSHSLILKTDGTLFVTGRNSVGQLGDGTTTNSSTPKQISLSKASVETTSSTQTTSIASKQQSYVNELTGSNAIKWFFWMTNSGRVFIADTRSGESANSVTLWEHSLSNFTWTPISGGSTDKLFNSVNLSSDGRTITLGSPISTYSSTKQNYINELTGSHPIKWFFWMTNSGKVFIADTRSGEDTNSVTLWEHSLTNFTWTPISGGSVDNLFNSANLSSDGRTITLGSGSSTTNTTSSSSSPFKSVKSVQLYNQNSYGVNFEMITNSNDTLYGNIKNSKLDSFITYPNSLYGGALVYKSENNKIKYVYEISSKTSNAVLEVKDGYFDVFTHDSSLNSMKYEGKEYFSTTRKTRVLPLWLAVVGVAATMKTINTLLDDANSIVNGGETILDKLKSLNNNILNLPSILSDRISRKFDNIKDKITSLGESVSSSSSDIFDASSKAVTTAKKYFDTTTTQSKTIGTECNSGDTDAKSCSITNGLGFAKRSCTSSLIWSSYGSCELSHCNTGYEKSGASCVKESTSSANNLDSTINIVGVWEFQGLSSGKVTISFDNNGRGEYSVNIPGYQKDIQPYSYKQNGTKLEFKYDSTGVWGTPSTIEKITSIELNLRNPDNTLGKYKKQSETSSDNSLSWSYPTKLTCESNGGQFNYYGKNKCTSNWDTAQKICTYRGTRLATRDELRAVITKCGGVIDDTVNNPLNESYQTCYKDLGFISLAYWSSTTGTGGADGVWFIRFDRGNSSTHYKSLRAFIRCVK